MDRKQTMGRLDIKSDAKGTFEALIATFNTVDSDGDVTLPGAFPEGKTVPISAYGHTSWEGRLPVGSGTLRQTRTEAVVSGRFYLDTIQGQDTWRTMKAMQQDGTPSEWSYGYDPKEYSFGDFDGQQVRFLAGVDVFEASPVLRGAGIGTRTLEIKSRTGAAAGPATVGYRGALPVHECDVVDERWEPGQALKGLGLAASIADLRGVHAWFDPTGDPERKSSYHFLHHVAPGGAANLRACLLGIAVLNGAKGAQVPQDVRQDVYEHLAAHVRDADREPPALRGPDGTLKLRDRLMVVLADVSNVVGEVVEVGASRAQKRERGLTGANREILDWISDELGVLRSVLDTPDQDAAAEFLRFVRSTHNL